MRLTREKIQRMIKGSTTVIGGSGSGSSGGGGGSADYAAEAGHALEADHATSADSATEATHATSADTATSATTAQNLASDSTDWNKIADKTIAQSIAEVWTFAKGIISTLRSVFNGGVTISKASGDTNKALQVAGGTLTDTLDVSGATTLGTSLNVTGNTTMGGTLGVTGKVTGTEAEFQTLAVTKSAHFQKLTVDELTSNKGAIIITSANCVAELVGEDQSAWFIYFSRTDRDGNAVTNPWKVGDQAICLTFKAEGTGTFDNVKNRYYWRRVIGVYSDQTGPDGNTYHVIHLSKTVGDSSGTTVPAAGDNIVQLGYQGQTSAPERQTAVILSSYPTMDTGVKPPSLAFYKNINGFALSNCRWTYIDGVNNEFIGNFKILVGNNYENLTSVLATIEGLILSVRSIVRSKNILRVDGWTNKNGDLLGSTNFNEDTQEFNNSNGAGGYDDVLWSPIFFLKAGTYTYSHYCTDGSVTLYVYGQESMFLVDEIIDSLTTIEVDRVVSGDTYRQAQRRYATFTLNDDCYVCLNPYLSDDEFTMYRPMLEEGDTCSGWEPGSVEHVNQIKILANAIDIAIRAGLHTTGINITDGTIKLMGNKVTFCDSQGGNTDKIWIDPTKGTLHAVDGEFGGTVRATNFYNNYCLFSEGNVYSNYGYYCIADYDYQGVYYYEGQYYTPTDVANVPASDLSDYFKINTYEANVINMVPVATSNWGSSPPEDRTVILPDPKTFEGKIIEIYSFYYSMPGSARYAYVSCVVNDSFATLLQYSNGHIIREDTGQHHQLTLEVGVPYKFQAVKGYINTSGGQDKWYWLKLQGS